MLKKLILLVVITLCLSGIAVNSVEASYRVVIDDVLLQLNEPPIIQNGRTLVPVSQLVNSIGGRSVWENGRAYIHYQEIVLELIPGESTAFVHISGAPKETKQLEVPAQLINSRVYVPLRFVAETIGGQIAIEGYTIFISTTGNPEINYDYVTYEKVVAQPVQENQQAKQEGLLSYLGKEVAEIIALLGQPIDSGYFQGAYYLRYDYITLFSQSSSTKDKIIFSIAVTGDDGELFGITPNMTEEEVKQVLGKPQEQYDDEYYSEEYSWSYTIEKWLVRIIFHDGKGSTVSTIQVIDEELLEVAQIQENQESKQAALLAFKQKAENGPNYEKLKKSAARLIGTPVYFTGRVLQALELENDTLLLVDTGVALLLDIDTKQKLIAVFIEGYVDVLDNDYVYLWGTVREHFVYETVQGHIKTVPAINLVTFERNKRFIEHFQN